MLQLWNTSYRVNRGPTRLTLIAQLLPVLVLLCMLPGSSVNAQQVRQAVLLQPAAATDQFTPEQIEARRKEASESADLSDDAKKKAEDHYRIAADGLKKIAELTAAAAQYKQDTDDVTQRTSQLKRRLAELQTLKPTVPVFASLPDLEQDRTKRDVQLSELKTALAEIEAEPTNRANRRKEIRALLLSSAQRAADLEKQITTPAPADEPPLLTQARQTELRVRRMLVDAELPALQNELSKYDAEDAADYVRLERDVRTQELALAEAELKLFDEKIAERRAEENAAALKRARDEAIDAQPLLREDAEQNKFLAEQAVNLTAPIDEARLKLEATETRLDGVQKQFTATQQKVENIGLSGAVGALLRRQRSELPNVDKRQANVRARRKVIEDIQYELFEADDQRTRLANREPFVQEILEKAPVSISEKEREQLESAARDVLDRRADYLDQFIRSANTYLDTLFELDQTEQLLIVETERYTTYIDERVLWIRSNGPLFSERQLDTSDRTMIEPAAWITVLQSQTADAIDMIWLYGLVVIAVSTLVLMRPKFRKELEKAGAQARRGNCTSFRPTWHATWLTAFMSITWPGFVWFLGYRLSLAFNGVESTRAIATALMAAAWCYLPLELLRKVCRVSGLADHHFDWPDSTIRLFRTTLPGLTLAGIPIVFITTVLYIGDPEHGHDLPERCCFVAGTIILTFFLRRVLRPDIGILCEFLTVNPNGWLYRTQWLWYWGSVLAPLSLGGLAIAGFYYTALQLAWRLFSTIIFVLALQLLRALLQRMLIVQRRKLSIEHAKKRRAELAAQQQAAAQAAAAVAEAQKEADHHENSDSADKHPAKTQATLQPAPTGPSVIVPPEELRADVEASTEQSRRLLSISIVTASLVGVWMIWVDVLPALRILDQWQLWATTVNVSAEDAGLSSSTSPSGGSMGPMSSMTGGDRSSASEEMVTVVRHVTPRDIALALLIGVLTVACARNIPGLMEMWILQRLPLDQSVRYAITTLTSYVIILLGIILGFNAISVGWSKVQWLATALTFGLAFGLQEIFANFVAGLILLFERPIRIGDVVTVDDVSGVVSRIRIRATTITNWDRKEYVIPNKEFITGRMLNWTLSDKINRVVINVGIAYGSDVDKAKELLREICAGHPLTLSEPATVVVFDSFGDNSLNLVVRTYLPDLDNRLSVIDALHTDIDRAFRAAEIEISFPQRDLHLKSVDSTVAEALGRTPLPSDGPELAP